MGPSQRAHGFLSLQTSIYLSRWWKTKKKTNKEVQLLERAKKKKKKRSPRALNKLHHAGKNVVNVCFSEFRPPTHGHTDSVQVHFLHGINYV